MDGLFGSLLDASADYWGRWAIVDTMEQQVRGKWLQVARSFGVSAQDCDRIAPAFAYPGFRC